VRGYTQKKKRGGLVKMDVIKDRHHEKVWTKEETRRDSAGRQGKEGFQRKKKGGKRSFKKKSRGWSLMREKKARKHEKEMSCR